MPSRLTVAPNALEKKPQSEEVLLAARSRLISSSYVQVCSVSCEYNDGVLTLGGCVPRHYLKQIAQEAVTGIAGVHRIVNRIKVTA